MQTGHRIDYKQLRKVNPEAARLVVLEYLIPRDPVGRSNGGNIAEAARTFGINRPVVYDILRKQSERNLRDRPKTPQHQPRRTSQAIEDKVVEVKNQTRLGPKRLSIHLAKYEGVTVPPGTIRHILARNKEKITYRLPSHRVRREKREFVDWYSAKPFEIVQSHGIP